eukprot:GHVN01071055.1.p1 GENE.GHVN01071055.1~~GHVN01071055.1.p1  ORF type:complete len:478 (+),score=84.96 GHVN01071055.1:138-1571(+)
MQGGTDGEEGSVPIRTQSQIRFERYRTRREGFTNHKAEHYARDALHVVLWAYGGVFCRQALYELSVLWSSNTALFPNLAANVVGSVLMGLLVSAESYLVTRTAPALYLAATTGYCGCLTTFSAWSVEVSLYALFHVNWYQVLVVMLLGLVAPIAGFKVGQHSFSLLVLLITEIRGLNRSNEVSEDIVSQVEEVPVQSCPLCQGDLEKRFGVRHAALTLYDHLTADAHHTAAEAQSESPHLIHPPSRQLSHLSHSSGIKLTPGPSHKDNVIAWLAEVLVNLGGLSDVEDSSEVVPVSGVGGDGLQPRRTRNDSVHQAVPNSALLLIALLLVICVFVSLVCFVVLDNSTYRQATWWWPALLAPIGALGRWGVCLKLNNRWAWPAGTFLVNWVASMLAAGLTGLEMSGIIPVDTVSWFFVEGVIKGLSASLSTISTFVAELYALPLATSYFYGGASCVLSMVCAMLCYGPWVWCGAVTPP